MATAVKRKLSASTDGMHVKVVETGSPGTTIHTSLASTTDGSYDEIYLWAYNGHTSAVILSIEFGTTELPNTVSLASKSGLIPIKPGLLLQNSKVVKAFASVANVVAIHGFVNRMTD